MTKSIWSRALSPFVEFEPEPVAQVATPQAEVAQSPVAVSGTSKNGADAALIAGLDQSARTQLLSALETCGADLVEELTSLLETLKDSITDEAALYKAALKILMKKGHSLVAIRQDFDKCVGVLEAKDREFTSQLKVEHDKRIGSKAEFVTDCNAKIEAKQAQILKLQTEISEFGVLVLEAKNGISEEQEKINLAKSRFTLGFQSLHKELTNNCAKAVQYGESL
jgi:hypothetical protein